MIFTQKTPTWLAKDFTKAYANIKNAEAYIYAIYSNDAYVAANFLEAERDAWILSINAFCSALEEFQHIDRSSYTRDLAMVIHGYNNYATAYSLDKSILSECSYSEIIDLGGNKLLFESWSENSMYVLTIDGLNAITATLEQSTVISHETTIFGQKQKELSNIMLDHAFSRIKSESAELYSSLGIDKLI